MRWVVFFACAAMLVAVSAAIAYRLVFDREVDALRNDGDQRLAMYAGALARDVAQYVYLPRAVSLDPRVTALFDAPRDRQRLRAVDDYLPLLNHAVGTLDVYLIDPSGRVMASSNWRQSDSFVGRDLSYRTYVRDARAGQVAEFYGVGTTHNDPGFYLSTAVERDGRRLGVVAVKLSLDQLARSWSHAESPALLADENGVIVLSSVESWKYATLAPLGAALRARLDQTQQYNRRPLPPLGLITRTILDANTRIVELHADVREVATGFATSGLFLTKTRAIRSGPWHLTVFYDLTPSRNLARTSAALAAAGTALLIAAVLLWLARRRAGRARLRNVWLSQNNARLVEEIRERREAERHLKSAQDELIQASKLAVIGQMAAGIAHEINQPLAALGTLSDNAREFLQRGDLTTAQGNLERISRLVLRLGAITGQLRSFARRSGDETGLIDLVQPVEQVLALLEQRLRKAGAQLERRPPPEPVCAHINALRLEQVLINLIGNALDACEAGGGAAQIVISWWQEDGRVRLTVADNGPGLSADAIAHLFEPFHSGKPHGLGLGLAISAGIVRDFGGNLSAGNRPQGGAEFLLDLPAQPGGPHDHESD
jgi:two-component system C4-dicarboxylate transport sensor histidine kinase DctB